MRRAVAILLCVLAAAAPAAVLAATPGAGLPGYSHTAWTAADGAPGRITAMAQTRDGWLWLGGADGLYRFDGVTFERVNLPERGMLGRALVYTLRAADNGDLWISYMMGGLSVLRADGRFDDIPERPGTPIGPLSAVDIDGAGAVWAIGSVGLYHYANGTWRTVVDGAAWRTDDTRSLLRGHDGTLWAAYDHRIWRMAPGTGSMVPAGAGGALLQRPDGSIWTTRGAAVIQVGAGAGGVRVTSRNQAESRWTGQFDRAGNLWNIRGPGGPCMLPATLQHGTQLDLGLASAARIAGQSAEQVLEDREGNIWIASDNGLDRYQAQRVQSGGLASAGTSWSIAIDADDAPWAADATTGALFRRSVDGAWQVQPERYARVVGRARDGALLVAGKRSIERRLHGAVTQLALPPGPDGKPLDLNVLGLLDDGKVLWMASYETGLMGYTDGRWQPRRAFNLPAKIVISSAGGPGQLWLADGDGGLSLYDNGKLTRYDAAIPGIATAVFAGSEVMVAGARGLAVLQDGAMRMLRADRPGAAREDVLRNISGMAVTPDGDRWFNSAAGIVHVRAADWQQALAHPQELLSYQLLDARDGYPGQAATMNRLPSVAQAAGGQLWFVATGGVVRLDTPALARNLVAPTVSILHVSTAQTTFRTVAALPVRLPPASSSFSIAWTAPALRRPEQLRYSWWLEGVDSGWRDGANARAASYTNVGPGTYRFHVRVANEDGVPGTAEAVQSIVIAPTVLQSGWFRALCLLAALLLGVAAYRYRIRVLTARLSERLQVRASERERIARTLHDTYLQTVNALMARVGAMAQALPADHPTRGKLETVLADASSAVAEGRGQVEQLRTGPLQPEHTLDQVVTQAAAPLRECYPAVAFTLDVHGTPRVLAPAVLEQCGQIAAEALRNVFMHANAAHIDVTIDYATPFSVTVQDDGAGLDAAVLRQGYRSGHWGLLGMRERARDIGARFDLAGRSTGGTTVQVRVPDAYADTHRRGLWQRLRARLTPR